MDAIPPVRVGVAFLDCRKLAREAAKFLIFEQNRLQRTFDFSVLDLGDTRFNTPKFTATQNVDLKEVERAYAQPAREHITSALNDTGGRWQGLDDTRPTHWLVVTQVPLWGRYYLLGEPDCLILSLAEWDRWNAPPTALEFILRICQRVCAQAVYHRVSHYASKGCLYDFNVNLRDVKFSVLNGGLCPSCRKRMEAQCSAAIMRDLDALMSRDWLGSPATLGSPAHVLKKRFGVDLYYTKDLAPSWVSRQLTAASDAGAQELGKWVFWLLIAALLLLFRVHISLGDQPPGAPALPAIHK